MSHEAIKRQNKLPQPTTPLIFFPGTAYFVILSNMLLGSKMNVGNTTRLKSAPGLSWEMICERTVQFHQQAPSHLESVYPTIALIGLYDRCLVLRAIRSCFIYRRPVACRFARVLADVQAYYMYPLSSPLIQRCGSD